MAVDLRALVDPATCALVTQECQMGVIGPRAVLPELAEVARRSGMIANAGRLAAAARTHGVPVIHCVAARRDDGMGANANARLFTAMARMEPRLTPGTEAVEVIPEIGVDPRDLVLTRYHGLGPMGGTDLDPILRNLGVRTVVGVGVSVNVGMTNLAMDAVNAGYQVVLPHDAIAGVPEDYAASMIANTLALIATLPSSAEVIAAWESAST